MRETIRPVLMALAVGCLSSFTIVATGGVASAQAQQQPAPSQAAPTPATPAPAAQPKQIDLTDKQIDGVLSSQKVLNAIIDKLPADAAAKPDPTIDAQLEAVVKKNGFASYGEYNDVVDTIGLVLGGFDPQTKTYVGPEAVIKGQIAAVKADKKMPADDKKEALNELNEALKTPPAAIANKANIDLVGKYYDKLAAAMQEE